MKRSMPSMPVRDRAAPGEDRQRRLDAGRARAPRDRRVRRREGRAADAHPSDVRRVVAGVATLLGVNITIGAGLLQQWVVVLAAAIVACGGILYLRRARTLLGE